MSTLYRLYRPQVFSDFVGQDLTRRILQNALVHNRTVHSYLFTGPRGTGKTSMARIFAKALNCTAFETETGEVCNACTNCTAITAGTFVDLIEIDAASNRGIDEIRNLREAVRFAPSTKNGAKVYIIDEVHMLTKDASNALLKTLEEPPSNVYFILVTTDAEKLLPTIHSRVQTLQFYPLSHSQLREKLHRILAAEGLHAEEEVLNQIVVQAQGGARNAESILGQLLSATETTSITQEVAKPILGQNTQHEAYQLLQMIADHRLTDAITFLNQLHTQGVAFAPFVDTLILTARSVLVGRTAPDLIFTKDLLETDREWLSALTHSLSTTQTERILSEFREAKENLSTALTPQLPLEIALTRLISESSAAPEPTPPPSSVSEPHSPEYTPSSTTNSSAVSHESTSAPSSSFSTDDSAASETPTELSMEVVRSWMSHIQQTIESEQTSLAPLFEDCQPSRVEDSTITFTLTSSFKKKKLDQYRSVIEDIIERLLGLQVRVQFETSDAPQTQTPDTPSPDSTPPPEQSAPSEDTSHASQDQTLESAEEIQKAAESIF